MHCILEYLVLEEWSDCKLTYQIFDNSVEVGHSRFNFLRRTFYHDLVFSLSEFNVYLYIILIFTYDRISQIKAYNIFSEKKSFYLIWSFKFYL